jgi:hypothetical protein
MKKNEFLLQILFGVIGYVILIAPGLFGLFIYPLWLCLVCGVISSFWFGPWIYKQYIIYNLRKNNPFNKR